MPPSTTELRAMNSKARVVVDAEQRKHGGRQGMIDLKKELCSIATVGERRNTLLSELMNQQGSAAVAFFDALLSIKKSN